MYMLGALTSLSCAESPNVQEDVLTTTPQLYSGILYTNLAGGNCQILEN